MRKNKETLNVVKFINKSVFFGKCPKLKMIYSSIPLKTNWQNIFQLFSLRALLSLEHDIWWTRFRVDSETTVKEK